MVTHSATLAIDETLRARRARGERLLHLAFGEAGLPVPREVADRLAAAAGRNGYGPVVGSAGAREAAAGWFTRRELPTEARQILFAPGSKSLLYALLATLPGDVVLPRPAWVSYAAQSALAGKRVIGVEVPEDGPGGVPDPERLARVLATERPGVLVLTVPDNPTGTVAGRAQLRAVCELAERHGLAVVADEIYAELVHDGTRPPSAATLLPERTVVTSGLSKSMALGGWRIGFARLPAGEWGERLRAELTGVASEVWSSLAAPMQAVAEYVLSDPPGVLAHIEAARRLHATVARAVHAEFTTAGALCRPPEGGFYLYPDFAPLRPGLAARGIDSGATLATELLERHGVGVLPGEAFGDAPEALRARVATSLLYGETEQERWRALAAPDPLALPWIAGALDHLRTALAAFTTPPVVHAELLQKLLLAQQRRPHVPPPHPRDIRGERLHERRERRHRAQHRGPRRFDIEDMVRRGRERRPRVVRQRHAPRPAGTRPGRRPHRVGGVPVDRDRDEAVPLPHPPQVVRERSGAGGQRHHLVAHHPQQVAEQVGRGMALAQPQHVHARRLGQRADRLLERLGRDPGEGTRDVRPVQSHGAVHEVALAVAAELLQGAVPAQQLGLFAQPLTAQPRQPRIAVEAQAGGEAHHRRLVDPHRRGQVRHGHERDALRVRHHPVREQSLGAGQRVAPLLERGEELVEGARRGRGGCGGHGMDSPPRPFRHRARP
nr:pyridoxal phosphate-dependent aminotransferase [Streptomyces sp. SBT349]